MRLEEQGKAWPTVHIREEQLGKVGVTPGTAQLREARQRGEGPLGSCSVAGWEPTAGATWWPAPPASTCPVTGAKSSTCRQEQ